MQNTIPDTKDLRPPLGPASEASSLMLPAATGHTLPSPALQKGRFGVLAASPPQALCAQPLVLSGTDRSLWPQASVLFCLLPHLTVPGWDLACLTTDLDISPVWP